MADAKSTSVNDLLAAAELLKKQRRSVYSRMLQQVVTFLWLICAFTALPAVYVLTDTRLSNPSPTTLGFFTNCTWSFIFSGIAALPLSLALSCTIG
jgi:uncharacterized membrane protein